MPAMLPPYRVVRLLSYWPPFVAAGIRVTDAARDMTRIQAELVPRPWNRNYVGTHFGGSLYAMCDPFYMFMLLHHLKEDHIVWDLAASIEFKKAVWGRVQAEFEVSLTEFADIRAQALKEFRVEPTFRTSVRNLEGDVVAEVTKTLYVRRKDAKTRFKKPSS